MHNGSVTWKRVQLGSRETRLLVRSARIARTFAVIGFAGLFATACDVHGISNPGTLASISVSPNPQTLAASGTQQFTAVGMDFSGAKVSITPTWSVVTGGGTISSSGVFTASTTPGTYTNTVMATSGSMTSTATVIVTAGQLAAIVISPNPQTMLVRGTQQFTAVGTDAAGNSVALTPTWSVAAGGGTISATGLFTAGSTPGTYANTIKATSGTISATATVTVTSPPPAPPPLATITVTPNPDTTQVGATQQFTAVGRDANGNMSTFTPVWSVVSGGGSIDSTGRFTAGSAAGTFTNTVKATSGTISGTATVTILATVPPPSASLINLGAAAPNGIMAGTAVTCVSLGTINAEVSISPGNTITGFGPCVITGEQESGERGRCTGADRSDEGVQHARRQCPCPPANLIVANLGGTTKTAGVYCSATGSV